MSLPKFKANTANVEVDGQTIAVHGVARKVMHDMAAASSVGDNALAEAHLIAAACDVSLDEAIEWLAEAPMHVADAVLTKVMELSNLTADESGKA